MRDLTGGRGVDRVVDMVGGDATRLNIEALARFGHLVLISTLADRNAALPLNQIVGNQLTVSGSTLRPQTAATKAAIAAHLRQHIWPALADAALPRPKSDAFPARRSGRGAPGHGTAQPLRQDRPRYDRAEIIEKRGPTRYIDSIPL